MVLRIQFTPIHFPDHTSPKGALSSDARSQACFYFYLQAQKMKERVGKSIDDQFGITDEYPWMDTHYVQLARTVAMMYELESPDEFAKAWDEVTAECFSCRLPEPSPEYTKLTPRVILQ